MWTPAFGPQSPALSQPTIRDPKRESGFQQVAEIASNLNLPLPAGRTSLLPATTISVRKRNLKRVEAICLIREQRESGTPEGPRGQ